MGLSHVHKNVVEEEQVWYMTSIIMVLSYTTVMFSKAAKVQIFWTNCVTFGYGTK